MRTSAAWAASCIVSALVPTSPLAAQTQPLAEETVALSVESGWVENAGPARATVFSTVLRHPGAPWLRLEFALAELGDAPEGGRDTILRVTSLQDGAVQHHTAITARQWRNTSAYFNGDGVRVEILADPGAGRSRVVMHRMLAGLSGGGAAATICGPSDDRVPSGEARSARLLPAGCTAWIIDDLSHCMLTAGHCNPVGGTLIQFNVPLSTPGGGLQHPPPADQYAVDPLSVQSQYIGLGNDWAYFGCFPNTETGLTAFEAQGEAYSLAKDSPPVEGQHVRITGYGVDDSPLQWNQTQQTHAAPYAAAAGTVIEYEVDTRGGNSGSAVLDERTGLGIGIHTNGGCDSQGGANLGTSIGNLALRSALEQPQGACEPLTAIEFVFPAGLPDLVHPAGGTTVRVEVVGTKLGEPQPGSGFLHVDQGGGFVAMPMSEIAPNVYDAVFPPSACGTEVGYYFSAASTEGETVHEPRTAPASFFDVLAAVSFDASFADDFEKDLGWTVIDSFGLPSGSWERGMPAGFGDLGDPPADADGSGRCYVSGLADGNNDIDGGSTTLLSPVLDATEGDAHIAYARWYSNAAGNAPMADIFVVEVSANAGGSWTTLEVVGPAGGEVDGGWFERSFRVADFIPATSAFRVRFTASDLAEPSLVEAAVDAVRLNRSAGGYTCGCAADVAEPPDGAVNVQDLVALITSWGTSGGNADINQDGTVNVLDLVALVTAWGPCP